MRWATGLRWLPQSFRPVVPAPTAADTKPTVKHGEKSCGCAPQQPTRPGVNQVWGIRFVWNTPDPLRFRFLR